MLLEYLEIEYSSNYTEQDSGDILEMPLQGGGTHNLSCKQNWSASSTGGGTATATSWVYYVQ